MKLGALDATVHTLKASEYGIQGFPTIKYFAPGKKDSSSVEDYDGGRVANDIISWLNDKLTEAVDPPEINQVSQKFFSDNSYWEMALGSNHPQCFV